MFDSRITQKLLILVWCNDDNGAVVAAAGGGGDYSSLSQNFCPSLVATLVEIWGCYNTSGVTSFGALGHMSHLNSEQCYLLPVSHR